MYFEIMQSKYFQSVKNMCRYIDLFISVACIASKDCLTCTEDSQMCSSCDVGSSKFLKEDDSSCVAVGGCVASDGYLWDADTSRCKCTYTRKHFYSQK